MVKNISIVVIVQLTFLVFLSSYGRSQAASYLKEKGSPNQMARADDPSENEMNRLKEEASKIHIGSSYNLSEDEIKTLQDRALRGAPEPAFRLYQFFELYKKDYKESLFWVMVSAENGHPGGEYTLGFKLKDDPDHRNRQRAIFWLKRAAEHGEKLAVSLLKELQEEQSEK